MNEYYIYKENKIKIILGKSCIIVQHLNLDLFLNIFFYELSSLIFTKCYNSI